ncbi:hypothetical protein JCM11491_000182 [Sporobolomyces phaffii]
MRRSRWDPQYCGEREAAAAPARLDVARVEPPAVAPSPSSDASAAPIGLRRDREHGPALARVRPESRSEPITIRSDSLTDLKLRITRLLATTTTEPHVGRRRPPLSDPPSASSGVRRPVRQPSKLRSAKHWDDDDDDDDSHQHDQALEPTAAAAILGEPSSPALETRDSDRSGRRPPSSAIASRAPASPRSPPPPPNSPSTSTGPPSLSWQHRQVRAIVAARIEPPPSGPPTPPVVARAAAVESEPATETETYDTLGQMKRVLGEAIQEIVNLETELELVRRRVDEVERESERERRAREELERALEASRDECRGLQEARIRREAEDDEEERRRRAVARDKVSAPPSVQDPEETTRSPTLLLQGLGINLGAKADTSDDNETGTNVRFRTRHDLLALSTSRLVQECTDAYGEGSLPSQIDARLTSPRSTRAERFSPSHKDAHHYPSPTSPTSSRLSSPPSHFPRRPSAPFVALEGGGGGAGGQTRPPAFSEVVEGYEYMNEKLRRELREARGTIDELVRELERGTMPDHVALLPSPLPS